MIKRNNKDPRTYWQEQINIKRAGRPKNIKSPQQLWELACEYFMECDLTPWVKVDYRGKDNQRVEIPTTTPYSKEGLDAFLNSKNVVSHLDDYRANRDGSYGEFSNIIKIIDNIIFTKKYEGAMVGAYSHRIIAHEMGKKSAAKEEGQEKQVFVISGQKIELG